MLLAVPPDNTISASPGGIRRAMVRGKRRAPWCGSPRRQWPARSEYRSPPELIPSIASASFGKPGLEHLPDLGPVQGRTGQSRVWSLLWRHLPAGALQLQLLSQPAVEVRRVCPGREGREHGAPATLARSQPARARHHNQLAHQGTGRSLVEPSIVARGPPMPSGRRRLSRCPDRLRASLQGIGAPRRLCGLLARQVPATCPIRFVLVSASRRSSGANNQHLSPHRRSDPIPMPSRPPSPCHREARHAQGTQEPPWCTMLGTVA